MYEYIAIERAYASAGHQIATELAKELHFRLYDEKVLIETCKRLDMPYSQLSDMDEHLPVKTPFNLKGGGKYLAIEEKIYNTEKEIIREAAEKPGCVFVGRCAGETLKDLKCLRVFITADFEFRKNRALNIEKLDPHKAEKIMHNYDTRRSKYFTTYARAKWGTPEYFDIVLNSGKLGVEACVRILAAACKG